MGYSPNTSKPQGIPGSLSTESNTEARGIIACLIPAPHRGSLQWGHRRSRTSPEVKSQAGYLPFQVAHNHSHNAPLELPDTSVTPGGASGSWAPCHANGRGFKCSWIARRAITELWFTADLLVSMLTLHGWNTCKQYQGNLGASVL